MGYYEYTNIQLLTVNCEKGIYNMSVSYCTIVPYIYQNLYLYKSIMYSIIIKWIVSQLLPKTTVYSCTNSSIMMHLALGIYVSKHRRGWYFPTKISDIMSKLLPLFNHQNLQNTMKKIWRDIYISLASLLDPFLVSIQRKSMLGSI